MVNLMNNNNMDTIDNFLIDGQPVVTLDNDLFLKKDGKTFIDQIEDYFKQIGGIAHCQFGDIILDRKGAQNDKAHGMSRVKAISFAAIVPTLEKGVVILPLGQYHTNDKKQETGMIAAPILIAGERYICVVVVICNKKEKRLYVHESFLFKKIHEALASSLVHDGNAMSPELRGNIANVLNNYLTSKQ